MEEKKKNIISHAMKSGLVLGGSFSLLMLLERVFPSSFMGFFINIASIVLLFYCLFHYTDVYKREVLEDKISYFHAVKYGIYMFFFGGMILAVSTYLYYRIFPEAFQAQIDAVCALIGDKEEYKEMLQTMQAYTVKDISLSTFSGFVFLGLPICLIASLRYSLIKKK